MLEDMGEQHEHLTFLNREMNDCYVTVILLVQSTSNISREHTNVSRYL